MVQIRETVCALLGVIKEGKYPSLAPFSHYSHVSLLSHYEINRSKFVNFLSLLSHSLITVAELSCLIVKKLNCKLTNMKTD